jgi:hypothetical protein
MDVFARLLEDSRFRMPCDLAFCLPTECLNLVESITDGVGAELARAV